MEKFPNNGTNNNTNKSTTLEKNYQVLVEAMYEGRPKIDNFRYLKGYPNAMLDEDARKLERRNADDDFFSASRGNIGANDMFSWYNDRK